MTMMKTAVSKHWSELPPAPLKLRPYGAIEIITPHPIGWGH